MNRNSMMLGLAVGVALLTSAVAQEIEYGPISGDAEKGKQFYYDYGCFACHGYGGIGRHDIANNVSGIMFNEQVFLIYLRARADIKPEAPSQAMPHYPASSLSDADAKDIYAYIRTLRDDPPEIEDIPAMQAILEEAKD